MACGEYVLTISLTASKPQGQYSRGSGDNFPSGDMRSLHGDVRAKDTVMFTFCFCFVISSFLFLEED